MSLFQLESTPNSLEDSTEETEAKNVLLQIAKDHGEFVKDRNGRFRVIYNDDDNIDEYYSCLKRVKIKADGYSSEFCEEIRLFLEGIKIQKEKRHPSTVIRNNNEQDSITPSESNCYREDREYIEIHLNKETLLYKHLEENSTVRIVKDMFTGIPHICKTAIMSKFRSEEVEAMLSLHKVAPELYVANRGGDYVDLHMELIEGPRLDTVARYMKNEHMWPLCLHIFSDILCAINNLMHNDLSHGDIHSKNIIIEVVENGKFRIRLIDYGDACGYTINGLINDMRSLAASLIALFTRNDFDAYNEDPDKWIEDNPAIWERYPELWDIFKGALDVKNGESLNKFIDYIEVLLVNDSTSIDFNNRLGEIAKLLKEET